MCCGNPTGRTDLSTVATGPYPTLAEIIVRLSIWSGSISTGKVNWLHRNIGGRMQKQPTNGWIDEKPKEFGLARLFIIAFILRPRVEGKQNINN